MEIHREDTAVVFTDPQNEVLSEKGLGWPLLRESLQENNTVENMERIFQAAKAYGFQVFISPHYFYPTDRGWRFNGPLESDEAASGMFARKGILNLEGLEGSGADWLDRFKPYIDDGKTVVVAPHRVFGPETNDIVSFPFEGSNLAAYEPALRNYSKVCGTPTKYTILALPR
jgi:hypothetical protein